MICNYMVNRRLTDFSRIAEIVVVGEKFAFFPTKRRIWGCLVPYDWNDSLPIENEKLIKKINEYEKKLTDYDDGAL